MAFWFFVVSSFLEYLFGFCCSIFCNVSLRNDIGFGTHIQTHTRKYMRNMMPIRIYIELNPLKRIRWLSDPIIVPMIEKFEPISMHAVKWTYSAYNESYYLTRPYWRCVLFTNNWKSLLLHIAVSFLIEFVCSMALSRRNTLTSFKMSLKEIDC